MTINSTNTLIASKIVVTSTSNIMIIANDIFCS